MGGEFAKLLTGINDAEILAIAFALADLRDGGLLEGVYSFMIQSDSLRALNVLKDRLPNARISKSTDNADSNLYNKVRKLTVDEQAALTDVATITFGRQVYVRHVKAHRGDDTGRTWVNGQCDKDAKKYMQSARRAIHRMELAL